MVWLPESEAKQSQMLFQIKTKQSEKNPQAKIISQRDHVVCITA